MNLRGRDTSQIKNVKNLIRSSCKMRKKGALHRSSLRAAVCGCRALSRHKTSYPEVAGSPDLLFS